MKTSIATVSISGDLEEKLAAIAEAGFDGVEIFENDLLAFDRSPAEVGRMVRDHGLEVTLFQPFRDFEGLGEPHRARTFDRAERKFDLMQDLGTDLMLVCSSVSAAAHGGIDRAAADFRELGERAAKRGLRVGYEALAWGRFVNDHRDAWEVVRRADHPAVGLILDSFHTLARGIDVASIRSIPGNSIFIVQLADAPRFDMDLLYWSRHFRNMPGEGDLPVTEFMQAVMATGYSGPISLEIFNDQFRGGSARSIAEDGHRSLVYLLDQVRRMEPEIAAGAPAMPDRIAVEGVEFVEFTASEEEASSLDVLLTSMGFSPVARHRNRAVRLYRQGEINIVINTQKQSFAHSSYNVHGLSAYAMGLCVEDAQATVERASALGATLFQEPRAPGELSVPAIRGVGGGVLYFTDRQSDLAHIWELEFGEIEEPGPGCGLKRIDHVAQTTNNDEMLSWLLFYTSIFKTRKQPMVDVVDPAGLVHSQAVEGVDGAFRLTLNGAMSRRTLAGRFVAESFGSALQHIAFTTDDIFATAAELKERGFETLAIPRNYYDDLEARLGLEPEFADRLRTFDILYESDGNGGEYFQLYSPLFGEGLFFEIVERRGGYGGYGPHNAQFRIAAQQRQARPKGMPRL